MIFLLTPAAIFSLYVDIEDEDDAGRPPPCIGICYYEKLMALQAKEEMLKHNDVLKEVLVRSIIALIGILHWRAYYIEFSESCFNILL